MRYHSALLCLAVVPLVTVQTARAQSARLNDGLGQIAALFDAQAHPDARGPAITLDEAERLALAHNPEITVAERTVAASQAHVATAGTLDDPVAMYRGWGVPLNQPLNFNAAQNMFSISQTFPGVGKRALQSGIALSDAAIAQSQLAQVRLAVRVRV
ncbi:MAG TPA: TolC family protein, partial [Terracidiphilus sp.]|nr:TolC family protein [Terracidiphilus sp.]